MPQHARKPDERRVAPRMGSLAAMGLIAAAALGAFAAIVTLVAGLALLALDAERHARTGAQRIHAEARRHRPRMSDAATAPRRRPPSGRRSVSGATH